MCVSWSETIMRAGVMTKRAHGNIGLWKPRVTGVKDQLIGRDFLRVGNHRSE